MTHTEPDLRFDPRMGGEVQRYHTWPTNKKQTVAEHGWNCARLTLALWPEAPVHIICHGLFHDIAEVGTGDIPFPVKRDNPPIKRLMDQLESSVRLSMAIPWGLPTPQPLDAAERWFCKLVDMLEMWESALCELMMGNQFSALVETRTGEFLVAAMNEGGSPWGNVILDRLEWYMKRRAHEWGMEDRLNIHLIKRIPR